MTETEEREVQETTLLLRRMSAGDAEAANALAPAVYEQLRRMAQQALAQGPAQQTLQPTALVHEAWMRLSRQTGVEWENRGHFLGVAGVAMRRILVDRARARGALKRGKREQGVEVADDMVVVEEKGELILAVDEALEKLGAVDPTLAKIAELRCFAGLQHDEIAEALGSSVRTVERGWRAARAFLQRALD